jgi:tetratricopeptide (TPR) repeat protein
MADPNNAEAHFRLGEVQLRLGEPIAAERELTLATEHGWRPQPVAAPMAQALLAQGRFDDVLKLSADGLDPSQHAALLVAQSAAELSLKRPADAQRDADQAQQLDPHSVDAPLASAQAAHARGDMVAETRAVDQALTISPHDPRALMTRAELLAAKNDQAGALAAADQALAAAPGYVPARLRRAELRMVAHDNAGAAHDLDAVLKVQPRNVAALYLNAELLAQARDFKGADAALQQITPVLSKIPRGEYLLALVKGALNQPEQALDAASSYLASAPTDPAGYLLMAKLDLAGHHPADAELVLNRAIAAGYADAEAMGLLGQAEAALGRPAQAVQDMQQAANLAPNDPALVARLASMRLGTGDTDAAVRDYERLVDMLATKPDAAPPTQVVSTSADAPQALPLPGATPTREQAEAALIAAALQAGDFGKAQAALERLRKQGAPPATIEALDGLIKLTQLDFPGAQAAFEAAIKDAPQAIGLKVELARILSLQGKANEARQLLAQAVAQNPSSAPALGALVAADLSQNHPDDALAAMESGHRALPDNVALTAGLADLYVRTHQAQKALDLLNPILGKLPLGNPPAPGAPMTPAMQLMAAKLRAQLALGQRPAAIDTARQILALQPTSPGVRRDLAGLLVADGRADDARGVLRDGLAMAPGNPQLLDADVALAFRTGGLAAALARADELMRDPANLPTVKILKADLYAGQKQYAQAAQGYRDALTDESPAGLAVRAAVAERQAGHAEQAADLLRGWIAKHPDAVDALAALGSFDLQDNRLDDAKGHYEAVLAKRPNDPAVLNNLAWILMQQHDLPRAESLARRSWSLNPLPQTADTLGWILLSDAQTAPAAELLRIAAAALPNDPSVQYHYAVALKDAGRPEQSKPILEALAQRTQSFPEQEDARQLLQQLGHP